MFYGRLRRSEEKQMKNYITFLKKNAILFVSFNVSILVLIIISYLIHNILQQKEVIVLSINNIRSIFTAVYLTVFVSFIYFFKQRYVTYQKIEARIYKPCVFLFYFSGLHKILYIIQSFQKN